MASRHAARPLPSRPGPRHLAVAVALALAAALLGCQCGPGVVCSSDAECGGWGRCALVDDGKVGFCVLKNSSEDGGARVEDTGGGAPRAFLSTGPLSFGEMGCGRDPQVRIATLMNLGGGTLTWSASLGETQVFAVTPSRGTLELGQAASLVVWASAPSTAAPGADLSGRLVLTTDDPQNPSLEVPLLLEASGVALRASPEAVAFGALPLGTAAPKAEVTVTNAGNVPATISVLPPLDAQFSLSWPRAPEQLSLPPGASVVLTAGFTPARPGPVRTTATLGVAEPICGESVSILGFSGEGGAATSNPLAQVSFAPLELDFGAVDCGTTAPPRAVVFRNEGGQSYRLVSTALGRQGASPFQLAISPSTGVLPPGGAATLTLLPRPIPAAAPVAADAFGDVLTVTTDVPGDSPHQIPLRQTARGAVLTLAPPALAFGAVPVGVTASASFTIANSGNAGAALALAPGQPSVFDLPATAQVPAGGAAALSAQFSPAAAVAYSDLATLAAGTTVLCAPLPAGLGLGGTGTNGRVVQVSPGALSFGDSGLVRCGTTAPARDLTLTNASSRALDLTYALGSSQRFAVSGPSTVAAGASATVRVTPRAIPSTASTAPDAFGDTLTIVAAGGPVRETHQVALHQTAQGAVLTFDPGALSFNALMGQSQSRPFSVRNAGNLDAPFTLKLGGDEKEDFQVSPSSGVAGAAGSAAGTATFRPRKSGTREAEVSLSTQVVRCAPLPGPLALTGSQ